MTNKNMEICSNPLLIREMQSKMRYHNSLIGLDSTQRVITRSVKWSYTDLINSWQLDKLIHTLEGNVYQTLK